MRAAGTRDGRTVGVPHDQRPPIDLPAPGPSLLRCLAARVHQAEDLALVLVLAAMVLLPVAEILRRTGLPIRVRGAAEFVRHLTLVAGMLGGAIAARERKLLVLSSLPLFLTGRIRETVMRISSVCGTAVTIVLCAAALLFSLDERAAGTQLAYGIPIWWVQVILPAGFGVIALRLLWQSGTSWRGRAQAAIVVAGLAWLLLAAPVDASQARLPAFLILLVAAILGAPIFVIIGGATVLLFWQPGVPPTSIALDHYDQATNPMLATVPLFTLAGYFLAESGASKRLVRVFLVLFGRVRGGPAIVTALVCAFFTTFTGGSGVTILALGGLLMPMLLAARFGEREALGLLTGAGSLGILLPPCVPLIFYAIIAQVPVGDMFVGGALPGLLMVGLTAAWGARMGTREFGGGRPRFDWREARAALWDAKWELALPVVAIGTFFSPFALAMEAAAVTALYAFVVEVVIHRDLKLTRDVPRVMTDCGMLVGGVLLILGTAMGLTNYLVTAHVPEHLVDWVTSAIDSPLAFLLALNLVLLVVGCVMDIFSAIIVVVPLIVPLGAAFGIDPVHLGVIFLANLELGYLTPPVGMNLFLSSYRFGKPVPQVARAALPMLAVFAVGVALITYVPALSTWLPGLLR